MAAQSDALLHTTGVCLLSAPSNARGRFISGRRVSHLCASVDHIWTTSRPLEMHASRLAAKTRCDLHHQVRYGFKYKLVQQM